MIRYFLILLFLLISCSDTINNTTTTVSTVESDTKGDLYVYAKDIVSGELISHAEYSSPVVQNTSLIIHGNKGICFQDLPVGVQRISKKLMNMKYNIIGMQKKL